MLRFAALLAAIVLGLIVVLGVTHPSDPERAIAGGQALVALAMLAKDRGV